MPDVGSERSMFTLHVQKRLSVGDGRCDFEPVADDARVVQQTVYVIWTITRNSLGVEAVEGRDEMLPLAQDGDPGEPGLEAFKEQPFKKGAIIVAGYAPFFVVVRDVERIAANPGATNRGVVLAMDVVQ